jgi:putative aldouronate transport system permease protein
MVGKRNPVDRGDRLFYSINGAIVTIVMLLVIYPLIYIVSSSFSSPNAVISGQVWLLPIGFSLEGYKTVFRNSLILSGYANSFFYTVFGTIINIVLTICVAYPLSRKKFGARNIYMFIFVLTIYFRGGLIPEYILISKLGLLNTRLVMILHTGVVVYNMIITRTYFQHNIPDTLYDAAEIDGMNDFGIMTRIVIPLSKSIIAVITLFYAVSHWNQFFFAFIYLNDKKLFPLQVILREILILNTIDWSNMDFVDLEALDRLQGIADLLKFSLIVVASLPVLLIYPFVQRYFVKGIMIGSIKG